MDAARVDRHFRGGYNGGQWFPCGKDLNREDKRCG
jgi:hypothetical protein